MASGWDVGGTVIRNNGRNTGTDVWAVDAAAAQPIDAAGHDTHDQGLADSIAECLHIGGYNAMTADLDMNSNDILSAVNVQASGDIVFTERADHASTPGVGKGYLWVRSDTPSSLIYTDDAGTDYDLTNITSVGTLPNLQVDNININGNTISSTAGTDLNITPLAGQQIVLDGTIEIDGGVVTGASSITSTTFVGTLATAGQPNITSLGTLTSLTVDNITINGSIITSSTGAISFSNEDLSTSGTVTCGSFVSTGISDTAGSTRIAIDDTDMTVGGSITDYTINRGGSASSLSLNGGPGSLGGGTMRLYGASHATYPSGVRFLNGFSNILTYTYSSDSWDFQDTDVTNVGEFTVDKKVTLCNDLLTLKNEFYLSGTAIPDTCIINFDSTANKITYDRTYNTIALYATDGVSESANLLVVGDSSKVTISGDLWVNDNSGSSNIVSGVTVNKLTLSASQTADLGANLVLFANAHASTPYDVLFRSDTTTELHFDSSGNLWDFQANAVATTGTISGGGLEIAGAGTLGIYRDFANVALSLSGDLNATSGANILLYGSAYAGASGYMEFRNDSTVTAQYSPLISTWDFQANAITTTGTVTIGTLKTGTHSAIGAETVTGYITIKDATGTDRKIAVVS